MRRERIRYTDCEACKQSDRFLCDECFNVLANRYPSLKVPLADLISFDLDDPRSVGTTRLVYDIVRLHPSTKAGPRALPDAASCERVLRALFWPMEDEEARRDADQLTQETAVEFYAENVDTGAIIHFSTSVDRDRTVERAREWAAEDETRDYRILERPILGMPSKKAA